MQIQPQQTDFRILCNLSKIFNFSSLLYDSLSLFSSFADSPQHAATLWSLLSSHHTGSCYHTWHTGPSSPLSTSSSTLWPAPSIHSPPSCSLTLLLCRSIVLTNGQLSLSAPWLLAAGICVWKYGGGNLHILCLWALLKLFLPPRRYCFQLVYFLLAAHCPKGWTNHPDFLFFFKSSYWQWL